MVSTFNSCQITCANREGFSVADGSCAYDVRFLVSPLVYTVPEKANAHQPPDQGELARGAAVQHRRLQCLLLSIHRMLAEAEGGVVTAARYIITPITSILPSGSRTGIEKMLVDIFSKHTKKTSVQ